jgi:glycosyltransferase involved in cell wall biosynthesis
MEPSFALCFEGRLSRELNAAGVPVYILGQVRTSRPWTVRQARGRMRELLARDAFDAVVCHMAWPLAIFGRVARDSGQRLAFWAHDIPTGRHWLERWARRTNPDVVIANSNFTNAAVPKLFSKPHRDVIYSPVDLLGPMVPAEERAAVRREFNIRDTTVVIIQVSRLEAWKGHHLHLKALSIVKGDWVCWMVGGPQRSEEASYLRGLQETAARLGIEDRVQFLGQRSDVCRLLAAADIFCQPNQNPEPFGIVFIEALNAGLPVVTTALGAAPEIVDESCGSLAPPDDAVTLAAMLERLIESRETRQALRRHARERARNLCDPRRQLARLERLLQDVAALPGAAAHAACAETGTR